MVLRVLSENTAGLSLGGISKASGIPRGTVQRLVNAMELEGFVARGDGDASIRLGQEIARLGISMNKDLRSFFRPIIEDLHRQSGETVDLSVLHPYGASVIDQIMSPHSLRVVSRPGQVLPLHATASGKAHLAQLPQKTQAEMLSVPLPTLTRSTITDVVALMEHVANTPPGETFRDREEYAEGICAVAVDLGVAGLGNVAISISLPAARFAAAEQDCAALLAQLRGRLSR